MRRSGRSLVLHVVLGAGLVLTVMPLLWMASASLMPAGEANTFPPRLWPSRATFEHYVALFTRLDLARHLMNSAIVAVGATLISIVVNGMAGYAFAKLRFGPRDRLFRVLLAALVIPGQVGMLPLFLMLQKIGLVNTLVGAMIPGLAPIFSIFMVRQYALGIPDELLDAARIDGASELRIYWTIVMPLLKPILATLATFTFLTMWNDFMWPLIVLSDDRNYTLPVALANLVGEHVQDTELMMAGSVLTVLPVMIVFVALQRAYIRGVTMGAIKG
ncbi:MAG: sugar ABC transporter permease [Candidatus Rokuibacteriota bacterium]|nr:MAG: sugar ABC transporter permease [Candidatus Rokubacteria bacterium]